MVSANQQADESKHGRTSVRVAGELERATARASRHSARAVAVELGLTPLADGDTVRASKASNTAGSRHRALSQSARAIPIRLVSEESERAMPESLATEMFVLSRQTENRLLVLQRDVSECKSVDEAANFTRWLQASGVLSLLERFETDGSLPVAGKALRKLAGAILSECGELYKDGKATPRYAASDIAEINRKLDIIAHRISQTP